MFGVKRMGRLLVEALGGAMDFSRLSMHAVGTIPNVT